MLAELDKYKTIKTEDIKSILLKELGFIKDKHFQVSDTNLTVVRTNYYSNEDLEFYKYDKGYFTIEKNKRYYLLKVNEDNNIENYLKLSINPEGKLLYYIGLISKDSIDRVDVTLKKSEKEENRTIELKPATDLINLLKNNKLLLSFIKCNGRIYIITIKVLSSLVNSNPFVIENVKILKRVSIECFIIALCYIINFLVNSNFKNFEFIYVDAKGVHTDMEFIIFIFAGCFIFILSKVFQQAVNYKEENDFTI